MDKTATFETKNRRGIQKWTTKKRMQGTHMTKTKAEQKTNKMSNTDSTQTLVH